MDYLLQLQAADGAIADAAGKPRRASTRRASPRMR
jgi:hypothetical protein